MSQPPAEPTQAAAFCTRCGAPLPAAAPRCPRCGAGPAGTGRRDKTGAALLALFFGCFGAHKFYLGRWGWGIVYLLTGCVSWIAGLVDFVLLLVMSDQEFQARYPGKGSTAATVLAIVLPIFCAVPTVGILAAIAIPNFVRYQLRSKASEVRLVLGDLARAEAARVAGGGRLVAFQPLPAGAPGRERRPLSPEERALQADLDWQSDPALYGQYRVAVVADERSGLEAAAFCAETDLDQDGVTAAWVAFLPAMRDGQVALAPPPAPCSEQARLEEGAVRYARQQPGAVAAASPADTF